MEEVFVFLADGFEDVEAITPIDYLRRADFNVITIGVTGKNVRSSHKVMISCDKVITEVAEANPFMAILPGGLENAKTLGESEEVKKFLLAINKRGGIIGANCASPILVLEPLGLLKDKKFTCYPGMDKDSVHKAVKGQRVVRDGNIITACGPGASEEFSLALIEAVSGKTAFKTISEAIVAR